MDYLTIVVDPAGEATVLNSSEEYRAMFNPEADADTGFGPQINQQAWSVGEEPTEPQPCREQHSWAAVTRRAAFTLGVGIAAAGVVLGGFRASASGPVAAPPTVVSAPDTSTIIEMPPPFTMPPDVPVVHETVDGDFLQRLHQAQITYSDPDKAVGAGKWVCDTVSAGVRMPDVINILLSKNPALSQDKANRFAAIAITDYCPQ